MSGTVIEVGDLTVRYGSVTAVDGISFTVEPGTITALLGPNGAGKTSTVEVLEGFRRPQGGTVRVLGLDPVDDHTALMRRVGVMLQEGGVYTAARPPEVLRLFASYYDDPLDPAELLATVGLTDSARTTWRNLSGGERQRLSLALALVGQPELLFLDEPTAGIDPTGRRLVRQLIASRRDEGVTVLVTTHDLADVEKLADRVVIIDHGVIRADDTPAALMAASDGDRAEIRFRAPPGIDVTALTGVVGTEVVEVSPGEYRAATTPSPETIATVTRWLADHDLALADLRTGRQSLEDVFVRLTEQSADEGGDG
jgi:ABC-2 type transport system ATP-binding protein